MTKLDCSLLSTVWFSILINGTHSGFINSSQGLRQGDPLFPLLFVIVMEVLCQMMSAAVNGGFISGFSMGSRNYELLFVSHLLFANGTLIFYGIAPNHFRYLRCVLLFLKLLKG
jgi:hypothetical protein